MAVLSKFYRLPLFLGALCFVMAIVLAVQWYIVSRQEQEIREQVKKPVESKIELADPPEDNLQLGEQGDFKEITSRPLFIKSRKPLPESTSDNDVIEASVAEPMTELAARFTGYIEVPGGRVALIKDTNTRKYYRLHQGEQINDWILTELHPDRVIFKQGDATEELLLRVPKVRPEKPVPGRPRRVRRPTTAPVRNQPNPTASARRQQLMKRIDRGTRNNTSSPEDSVVW